MKQSLDELRTRDNQLIPKNITRDILDVDDLLTVTEAMMSGKMITQEKREVETANENEEGDDCSEQVTEHDIAKPSTSKVQEAIETPVNFPMFSENNKIGDLIMSASRMVEKELVSALKEKTIGDFICVTTVKILCIFICCFLIKLSDYKIPPPPPPRQDLISRTFL